MNHAISLATGRDRTHHGSLILRYEPAPNYECMNTDEILSYMRVGTWEVDLVTQTIYWSNVTRQIHDAPEDYLLTYESVLKFYKAGYNRERVQMLFAETMQHGTPFEEDFEFTTYTGRAIWVRTNCKGVFKNGVCIKLLGTFMDVSHEKIMQAKKTVQ